MAKKKKLKKHELIRKKIEHMNKADELYCNINSCNPSDYMRGKINVYQDLTNFINRL